MEVKIVHHGAVNGVTGSCHQLFLNDARSVDVRSRDARSVLVDCGLFQGNEAKARPQPMAIDFDIDAVSALLVTHTHIDHVGRIPFLLAKGFTGPIYASEASAALLPLVLEDAMKVGVTRNRRLITRILKRLAKQLRPMPYHQWQQIADTTAKVRLQPAGHILGSAYVEIDVVSGKRAHRVVFSGDLGAPHTPMLPEPKSPEYADTLVIESTYGDRCHQNRKHRIKALQQCVETAIADNGIVLIPAFSMGRTQELLYELEQLHHNGDPLWQQLEVIIDSPLAATFTDYYRQFKTLWDAEAKAVTEQGRHPLDFEQLYTVDDHKQHQQTLQYLKQRNKAAIVIAAGGMCNGGRIVNYLEQFIEDPRTDIIFVGYQAEGTIGRTIQRYGPTKGYVDINDSRFTINASVHTISGYSAHADQSDLINFVAKMAKPPKTIRIVHGDDNAKTTLKQKLQAHGAGEDIIIPTGA